MKRYEYYVECTTPGELTKVGESVACKYEASTLENAKAWLERMRKTCEDAKVPFEVGRIYCREISDWEQVYPLAMDIDMHVQPDAAVVNGKDDFRNGIVAMPFVEWLSAEQDLRWQFRVDVATGVIQDWPEGITAEAWYKPSDDIKITVGGKNLNDGQYVPKFLRPRGDDADYVELVIDQHGKILEWDSAAVEKWIAARKKRLKLA